MNSNTSRHEKTHRHALQHKHSFKLQLIVQGIGIGLAAGLIAVLYRLALEIAGHFALTAYSLIHANYFLVIPWFFILTVSALMIGKMVQKNPMISGSGIPQVEGFLLGRLDFNWLKVLVFKFLGGVLSIGSGFSLGREGPSVQLGAAVGLGFSTILKRKKLEEKYLVTGGASAGLSAAFNAPLAGVLFALEEVHKNFSPSVLITALSSSLTAAVVSSLFFGLKPVFTIHNLQQLPLDHYLFVILLGAVTGVLGVVFNSLLLKFQRLYADTLRIPVQYRAVVPVVFSIVIGLFLPQVLGGGHELINDLFEHNKALLLLCVMVIVKFFFTMICYGSSAPGGIFLPLLSLGALIGNIFGLSLVNIFGMDEVYARNFIILAMAGYFTAIVRAPVTGIILITEMTGSFSHLLSVSIVCIVSYIAADFLYSKPVYESLLDRLLSSISDTKRNNHEKVSSRLRNDKAVLEFGVCAGSDLDGKKVCDISWPKACLLVSVKRGLAEIIPHGDTVIQSGDYLSVLADEGDIPAVNSAMAQLIKCCDD